MGVDNSKSNLGITATHRMSAYLIQFRTDNSQATFTMTHNYHDPYPRIWFSSHPEQKSFVVKPEFPATDNLAAKPAVKDAEGPRVGPRRGLSAERPTDSEGVGTDCGQLSIRSSAQGRRRPPPSTSVLLLSGRRVVRLLTSIAANRVKPDI